MRFFHAATLCVAVVLSVSCVQSGPAGTAAAPGRKAADKEVIVLLPKPDGKIGGVIVRGSRGNPLLLNTAYAGAEISPAGAFEAVTYDGPRARREFGPALDALPGRPTSFLLYFLEGRDDLTAESETEIEAFFADIAKRADPEIWVIGHADAVGSMQFNDQLSLQRAQRVKEDLTQRGIPADRIRVSGRGKREPLVLTAKNVPEPKNRRVEISVR